MKVKLNPSALGESHWYEYVIRFFFGGLVTASAGVVAKRYGPEIGGLFLAFPAIFPAAATLIAKHEEKRENNGHAGNGKRGIVAAGLDATGAIFGAVGLVVFACVVWKLLPDSRMSIALSSATIAWAISAVLAWQIWELLRRRTRAKRSHRPGSKLSATTR